MLRQTTWTGIVNGERHDDPSAFLVVISYVHKRPYRQPRSTSFIKCGHRKFFFLLLKSSQSPFFSSWRGVQCTGGRQDVQLKLLKPEKSGWRFADGIFKCYFSTTFFFLKCHSGLFQNVWLTIIQAWFHQATSHCPNQWRRRFVTPYEVTRPEWANGCDAKHKLCYLINN